MPTLASLLLLLLIPLALVSATEAAPISLVHCRAVVHPSLPGDWSRMQQNLVNETVTIDGHHMAIIHGYARVTWTEELQTLPRLPSSNWTITTPAGETCEVLGYISLGEVLWRGTHIPANRPRRWQEDGPVQNLPFSALVAVPIGTPQIDLTIGGAQATIPLPEATAYSCPVMTGCTVTFGEPESMESLTLSPGRQFVGTTTLHSQGGFVRLPVTITPGQGFNPLALSWGENAEIQLGWAVRSRDFGLQLNNGIRVPTLGCTIRNEVNLRGTTYSSVLQDDGSWSPVTIELHFPLPADGLTGAQLIFRQRPLATIDVAVP